MKEYQTDRELVPKTGATGTKEIDNAGTYTDQRKGHRPCVKSLGSVQPGALLCKASRPIIFWDGVNLRSKRQDTQN